ncbi:hypothetical protein FRC09_020740 [Ceratobasidium sp. 395]|nr:hypothetical protein FRC09_020740 [Ceratobasidium sp. 395]
MLSIKAVFAIVALWVSIAQAQLTISEPSGDRWWVAQSQNTLRWSCNTSPYTNWTVLITNPDVTILSGPLALIAILLISSGDLFPEYNYDCSKTIIPGDQLKPGTGYTMLFGNPLNNTEVWATSAPFEVKPLGSTYPPQITTSEALTNTAPGATGSSNPTATSTPNSNNGAIANAVGVAFLMLAGVVSLFIAA